MGGRDIIPDGLSGRVGVSWSEMGRMEPKNHKGGICRESVQIALYILHEKRQHRTRGSRRRTGGNDGQNVRTES
jgi:hypothetical protein